MEDTKKHKPELEKEDVEVKFTKDYGDAVNSFFKSVVDTLKEL